MGLPVMMTSEEALVWVAERVRMRRDVFGIQVGITAFSSVEIGLSHHIVVTLTTCSYSGPRNATGQGETVAEALSWLRDIVEKIEQEEQEERKTT